MDGTADSDDKRKKESGKKSGGKTRKKANKDQNDDRTSTERLLASTADSSLSAMDAASAAPSSTFSIGDWSSSSSTISAAYADVSQSASSYDLGVSTEELMYLRGIKGNENFSDFGDLSDGEIRLAASKSTSDERLRQLPIVNVDSSLCVDTGGGGSSGESSKLSLAMALSLVEEEERRGGEEEIRVATENSIADERRRRRLALRKDLVESDALTAVLAEEETRDRDPRFDEDAGDAEATKLWRLPEGGETRRKTRGDENDGTTSLKILSRPPSREQGEICWGKKVGFTFVADQKEADDAVGAEGSADKPETAPAPEEEFVVIDERRFRRVLQKGDGNCLFRALAHSFKVAGVTAPRRHGKMRQDVINHAACHWKRFGDIAKKQHEVTTKEDYESKLRSDGEWGDYSELVVAADLFGVPIQVYNLHSKSLLPEENNPSGSERSPVYVLFDLRAGHYDALVPVDDAVVGPADDKVHAEPMDTD